VAHPRQLAGETVVESERTMPEPVTRSVRSPRPQDDDDSPRPVIHHHQAAPRIRMGF